jgi:hypothetical protein
MTFRKQELAGEYVGFTDRPSFADARKIGEEMVARYVDEEVDRVELIYNRFVSPLTQHVWRQTLLPLQQAEVVGEGAESEEEADETESGEGQARSEWFFDRDAQRGRERRKNQRQTDPGDEPRPPGGNHPGDPRGRRRRRGAELATIHPANFEDEQKGLDQIG